MAAQQQQTTDRNLIEQVTEYIQLQLTATKLSAIELTARSISNGFGILLAVVAFGLALLFALGAATLWIAELLGSLVAAMMISASIFVVMGIVVYAVRGGLITDLVVRNLARMLFESEQPDDQNRTQK